MYKGIPAYIFPEEVMCMQAHIFLKLLESKVFSLPKCLKWSFFYLEINVIFKCHCWKGPSYYTAQTFSENLISLDSNFCERQTEIQRRHHLKAQVHWRANGLISHQQMTVTKYPIKQRISASVTVESSHLFAHYKIWHMYSRSILEPCWVHISFFFWQKTSFALILIQGDSCGVRVCVCWNKLKFNLQHRVICHGWLSKRGTLNEYFNWSITFLNFCLLTFLPAVSSIAAN